MVLGCMLNQEAAVDEACDEIKAADFYYREHGLIFEAMDAVRKESSSCDVTIVAEMLRRKKTLGEIGGVKHLVSIAQFPGTSAYITDYLKIVKTYSMLRILHGVCTEIAQKAATNPSEPYDLLDEAQKRICGIGQKSSDNAKSLEELFEGPPSFMKIVEERQFNKGSLRGITTGINGLDKLISGLQPGHLITIGARPAMGKTAFALNMAMDVALRSPVAFFSLEMTSSQLLERIACASAAIDMQKMLAGELTESQVEAMRQKVAELRSVPLYIDDRPQIKIGELKGRARRLKERHGIGLICIDYLQLILCGPAKEQTREQSIGEITRELKGLARELNVPVLALSQLSRKVEERVSHKPMLSDLRESGSVEQESDSVILLYRPEYYDQYDKPGMTYAIVAKNRHGPIGDVEMKFFKEYQRFADWEMSPNVNLFL
jgi:replicative DNA helicase